MSNIFLERIKDLKTWLERLGYSKSSIKRYTEDFRYFFKWLEKQYIDLELLNQDDITKYFDYLNNLKIKQKSVYARFYITKLYDKYLQLTNNKKIITKSLKINKPMIPSNMPNMAMPPTTLGNTLNSHISSGFGKVLIPI